MSDRASSIWSSSAASAPQRLEIQPASAQRGATVPHPHPHGAAASGNGGGNSGKGRPDAAQWRQVAAWASGDSARCASADKSSPESPLPLVVPQPLPQLLPQPPSQQPSSQPWSAQQHRNAADMSASPVAARPDSQYEAMAQLQRQLSTAVDARVMYEMSTSVINFLQSWCCRRGRAMPCCTLLLTPRLLCFCKTPQRHGLWRL